jgi:hypothetical protein
MLITSITRQPFGSAPEGANQLDPTSTFTRRAIRCASYHLSDIATWLSIGYVQLLSGRCRRGQLDLLTQRPCVERWRARSCDSTPLDREQGTDVGLNSRLVCDAAHQQRPTGIRQPARVHSCHQERAGSDASRALQLHCEAQHPHLSDVYCQSARRAPCEHRVRGFWMPPSAHPQQARTAQR